MAPLVGLEPTTCGLTEGVTFLTYISSVPLCPIPLQIMEFVEVMERLFFHYFHAFHFILCPFLYQRSGITKQ